MVYNSVLADISIYNWGHDIFSKISLGTRDDKYNVLSSKGYAKYVLSYWFTKTLDSVSILFISNIILHKFPLYVNCILKGWCYHILLHHCCRIAKKAFMLQKLFHKPQECIHITGHMSFNTGFVCQEACTACSWQNCWTFVAPCCSVQKIQRQNGAEVWV